MFEPHASKATFLLFTFEDKGPKKAAKDDAHAGSTMRFNLSLIIFIELIISWSVIRTILSTFFEIKSKDFGKAIGAPRLSAIV